MKVEKFCFYQTKSGAPVRIVTTTAEGDHPVQGEALVRSRWVKMKWTAEGKRHYFGKPSPNDLVLIPNPFNGFQAKKSGMQLGPEIKLDGSYRTIENLPVRIYAVDCGGNYPVHGSVLDNGEWRIMEWTSDGKRNYMNQYSKFNLVEAKKPTNNFQAAVDKANDFINSISISPTQNRTG